MPLGPGSKLTAYESYRLRLKRRRLLWRAILSRSQLANLLPHPSGLPQDGVLCFATMRNEIARLPYYLKHYRKLGVARFLIVDNDSTDGTTDYLMQQPDVSLWTTKESYKAARFGMDWLTWLQLRYGHGRWCLTADADEILRFPDDDCRSLLDLIRWLDRTGRDAFGALMLDMYPKSRLSEARYEAGEDPFEQLCWFDQWGYTWEYLRRFDLISIRGGVRQRVFFDNMPEFAPHLHKIPLVRWHWRYAYGSSTHFALPRRLNTVFDHRNGDPTGVLLHSKFIDQIIDKSDEEKGRQEHFTHSERYTGYYDAIIADPVLWSAEQSTRFYGRSAELEEAGLMRRGDWS